MPPLSATHFRRELLAWMFLPVMLGAVEGGITGVLAKNLFEGAVGEGLLNLAVAVLAGAPAFANVVSFVWAALGNGRHKIRFMVGLQIATALAVGSIALAPRSEAGLALMIVGMVGARVCWSGVVTFRSTVWQANYPRSERATLAGRFAMVQALILTAVALAVGLATRVDQNAFRVIYPAAAALGLAGTWIYSGMRVRGHRRLLLDERRSGTSPLALVSPLSIVRVLRSHRRFLGYMVCMFLFGTGNQMTTAPLIIMLRDRFGMGVLASVLITSVLPTLVLAATISRWSPVLDRMHILRFRAMQSWVFVAVTCFYLLGTLLLQPWLLYLGATVKGVAMGGGMLGWNLGHLDFAPPHRAGQFMGVHVTLTGVRGLLAPLLAVGLYELLEAAAPGSGPWTLAVCMAVTVAGVVGFNVMARRAVSGEG